MFGKVYRLSLTIALFLSFTTIVAAQNSNGGIGIKIAALETGELVILNVYEGYPADLVGLEPGDIITHVDGIPTENTSYCQVVSEWIKGPIGEDVVITVARFGEEDLFSVTIERGDISSVCKPKADISPLPPALPF